MLKRLYIDNYHNLLNFEIKADFLQTMLFIGENGAGKSSTLQILSFLQKIASGDNDLDEKFTEEDFGLLGKDQPMTFELEIQIDSLNFRYRIVLDYPKGFYRPRVVEEVLAVNDAVSFSRKLAAISLQKANHTSEFSLDWHIAALSVIQTEDENDPVGIFRKWMKEMILTAPCPQKMENQAMARNGEFLSLDASNFVSWLSRNLGQMPQIYSSIDSYLREIFPDFKNFIFTDSGPDTKKLSLQFDKGRKTVSVSWDKLSDGEKCLFVSAAVYAVVEAKGKIFCFWDEPNNYISNSLLNCFIRKLRMGFEKSQGQFWVISHNFEIISGFNDHNTFVFRRNGHTEGTLPLATVEELRSKGQISGSLINSILLGDLFDAGE